MTANIIRIGGEDAEAFRGTDGRLVVDGITKRFGGLVAVDDVSLEAPPGQITSLIGPNGAGKTTLFDCLTGMLEADSGNVTLDGLELIHMTADARARAGPGRTSHRLAAFTGDTRSQNPPLAPQGRHTG